VQGNWERARASVETNFYTALAMGDHNRCGNSRFQLVPVGIAVSGTMLEGADASGVQFWRWN
jgi:hypothetical protein